MQRDPDGAGFPPFCNAVKSLRERVLERIRDQLVDDQPAGSCPGDVEERVISVYDRPYEFCGGVRGGNLVDQGFQVDIHIDIRVLPGPVQGLVDKRHGPCPVLEILFECKALRGIRIGVFEADERDECGKVVLDPVVDLGEEDILFFQGFFEFRLALAENLFTPPQFADILLQLLLRGVKLLVDSAESVRSS